MQTPDFTQMDSAAICIFLCEHFTEFDENDVHCAGRVAKAVEEKYADIEKRPWGFAVVGRDGILQANGEVRRESVLWYLYIATEFRGPDKGDVFVRDLLVDYASKCCMTLLCYGEKRAAFFTRCGFVEESSPNKGWRSMRYGNSVQTAYVSEGGSLESSSPSSGTRWSVFVPSN